MLVSAHRLPDGQKRRNPAAQLAHVRNRHRFTVVAVEAGGSDRAVTTGTCHGPTI